MPCAGWLAVESTTAHLSFIQKCLEHGEATLDEVVLMAERVSLIAQMMLEALGVGLEGEKGEGVEVSAGAVAFLRLDLPGLFKLEFQMVRTVHAFRRMAKRVLFVEFASFCSAFIGRLHFLDFHKLLKSELAELFGLKGWGNGRREARERREGGEGQNDWVGKSKGDVKEGRSQRGETQKRRTGETLKSGWGGVSRNSKGGLGDQHSPSREGLFKESVTEPPRRLFSELLGKLFFVLNDDLLPAILRVNALLCSQVSHPSRVPSQSLKDFPSALDFSSSEDQDALLGFLELIGTSSVRQPSTSSHFEIDSRMRFVRRAPDWVSQCDQGVPRLRLLSGVSKTMTSHLLLLFVKGVRFDKMVQRSCFHFGISETQFIKAFEKDPLAFQHQILDFDRLTQQVRLLRRLLAAPEKDDCIHRLKSEVERLLGKVLQLFRKCESAGQTGKLQSVVFNSGFHQELLDLLTHQVLSGLHRLFPKEGVRRGDDSLIQLVMELLERFCQDNPWAAGFGDKCLLGLFEMLLSGVDVSALLFVVLSQLRHSWQDYLVEAVYSQLLTALQRLVVERLHESLHNSVSKTQTNLHSIVCASKLSKSIHERWIGELISSRSPQGLLQTPAQQTELPNSSGFPSGQVSGPAVEGSLG